MYIYLYIHIYIHKYIYIYTYILYVYTYIYIHIFMHIYVHIYHHHHHHVVPPARISLTLSRHFSLSFIASGTRTNIYCYAAMCLAGLQGAKSTSKCREPTLAVVCRTLFNVTDTTNSQAEPHFKATRRVLGELLKVNTANWLAFPLKYKVFDKHNSFTRK